jgi:hypothetical protein
MLGSVELDRGCSGVLEYLGVIVVVIWAGGVGLRLCIFSIQLCRRSILISI